MNKRITNICRSKWKNENEQYLYELQKFLDADLRQAEISGGRLGLRKGLDY